MNHFAVPIALWLADILILSTVLLALALVVLACIKQPAQRLAVTKSALVALFLLAALCAVPGWSLMSLFTTTPPVNAQQSRPITSLPTETNVSKHELGAFPPPAAARPAASLERSTSPRPPATFWSQWSPSTLWVAAYAIGCLGVAVWLVVGQCAAHRVLRTAQPAPAELTCLLAQIAGNSHHQLPLLRISPAIDVAVALGIRRPAILLPRSLAELHAPIPALGSPLGPILAHELAHITNHDLHWLAAGRALVILFWPQPLVWLLRRRIRLDQEALADAAAAELSTRQTYAEQLVAWARQLSSHPTPYLSAAVGLWESPSQLRQRIAFLIDEKFTVLRKCSRGWHLGALVAAIAAALALSTVTTQPSDRGAAQPAAPAPAQREPVSTASNDVSRSLAPEIPHAAPNTILGRTIDENDRPLADAEALLFRINRNDNTRKLLAQTESDAAGNFRFDNVIDIAKEFPDSKFPPQTIVGDEFIQTVVRAPGRVSSFRTQLPQQIAHRGDVQAFKLSPAATLRGRITGPDGQPVRGALVSAATGMFDHWEGILSARTDADGNYAIDDVAQFDMEQYRTERAEQERRASKQAGHAGTTADLLWFAPPMLTVEHPEFALKKTAFEKIPGTKDVQLAPAAILEGHVTYSDSQPAAGVLVQAATSNPNGDLSAMEAVYNRYGAVTRTDVDGKFRFTTLPAGTYDLWADSEGWVSGGINQLAATAQKITAAPDLTLSKGALLRIRLIDKGTNQPVELRSDTIPLLLVRPRSFPSTRPVREKLIPPEPDGRFEVRTYPGENQITAVPPRSGAGPKWFGTTVVGADSSTTAIADGSTVEVDVPVSNIKTDLPRPPSATFTTTISPLDVAGKPREAVESLTKRLKDDPDNHDALLARSDAFQRLGEPDNAIADLEHLIRLNPPFPKNFVAHNNLAHLLSTASDDSIRDGKRAVGLALRAIQLAGDASPELLDTLAAAYAENREFDTAIETQQKSIELAPSNQAFRHHLELYQQKKPLRAQPSAREGANDITGQVLKPDGTPASRVKVIAFSMVDPEDISKGYGYQRTQTDDDGRFRLSLYSGGREVFWILPRNYSQQTHIINDRRGDLGVFQLENGLNLYGRVLDENSKPISDIWVNAELKGGPAFRNIEMPVADNIERASLTDDQGRFDLGPLPPGTYEVVPDETPEDNFENDQPRKPLPAAFVPQRIQLSAASELEEVVIRPVESVTIQVRFVDSRENPARANGFFLIGTTPEGKRIGLRRDQTGPGAVTFVAPKGLEKTVIDFPLSSMRVRRAPDEPWQNDHSLELGTLEHDWREIEVVRYREPTLIVAAKDADGNRVPGFKPAIFYHYEDRRQDRKNRWIDDVRGDVDFEPLVDGRRQSEHLLPDEAFTLSITAEGYQSFEQSLSLKEGEFKELTVALSRTADVPEVSRPAAVRSGRIVDELGRPIGDQDKTLVPGPEDGQK
jgi:beta-lactamase regulating signal transducer with metallopeptidase domain/tetratricopeptide (TPR) repeat protein/protocatechuate 3,4-dioxygenase beta subunit